MPPSLKPAITFVEKKDLNPAKLVRLYQQAPWAKGRILEDAREMLRHTDVAVMAWDGDVLIGFGRVLTDYVYRATIWDVIVDKAYQGQGIGADIVEAAKDATISERIAATGQDMVPAGPDELAATIKEQGAKAAAVAKVLGMPRKN